MLQKINRLKPFFEDCYREISVREYAREIKISPPTASKLLKEFVKEDLLKQREDRGFLLFRINREGNLAKSFSRIYWTQKLEEIIVYLNNLFHPDAIVLFGSLSKLEVTKDSDVDVAVLGGLDKEIVLDKFEKKLGRKIQLFLFENFEKINKSLKPSIANGQVLQGYVS